MSFVFRFENWRKQIVCHFFTMPACDRTALMRHSFPQSSAFQEANGSAPI
ncbi:hypothetical protein ALP85_102422 [Pseudomonas syringae pv. syringae]|nr:hypothetical protein ALP85_102422 [Pseudomonas syringae pv. syringae]